MKNVVLLRHGYKNSTTATTAYERTPGGIRVTIVCFKIDENTKPLGETRRLFLLCIGVWPSLDKALVWGTRDPQFKSGHPDQIHIT